MANFDIVYRIATDLSGLKDGVQQTTQHTEAIDKKMTGLVGSAKTAVAGIGAAFTALQVKAAVDQVVSLGDSITDLGAKTGISAEAVQELTYVAEQNGASFDQVSKAILQMGDRLAGGDKSAVGALKDLGLSFDEIRAMSPDQAFEAIATAVGHVEDPMQRSKLAMDIFGRAGAELLPVMTSDVSGLRDRARDLGLVMSNDVVRAGADVDDRMQELHSRLTTLKASALEPLLSTFLDLPPGLQTGIVAIGEFLPALTGIATTIMAAGGPVAILGTLKTALMGLAGLLTMPAGLVVAAVVGLVAIWYKWDEIKAIAESVYTAVKTWLLDKFTAIVDGIKAKIDAVTGFFSDMYHKVVGGSFVPDMIAGIAAEFAKLHGVMVGPTEAAALATTNAFSSMKSTVLSSLTQMGSQIDTIFGSNIAGFFQKFQSGPLGGLMNSLEQAFGPKVGAAMGKMKSLFQDGFNVVSGIGRMFAGDFSGVAQTIMSGINLIKNAWNGIKGLFGGGEEGTVVNPARDKWFNEHGGSVESVGMLLADKGVDGETARQMIEAVFKAKTKYDFEKAAGAISRIVGFADGGIVTRPTFAMIGEAGPEMVIPLPKLDTMMDGGGWAAAEQIALLRRELTRRDRILGHLIGAELQAALARSA